MWCSPGCSAANREDRAAAREDPRPGALCGSFDAVYGWKALEPLKWGKNKVREESTNGVRVPRIQNRTQVSSNSLP